MGGDVADSPEEIEGAMKKKISRGAKRKAISREAVGQQLRLGNVIKGTNGKRIKPVNVAGDPDAYWAKERKRQKMELKLEEGKLIITLPRIVPPTLSRSGKSFLIATSGGVKRTPLLVDGAPIYVVATAFTYVDWVPPAKWVPLLEVPKTEEQEEEEEAEREWATIPLLE
jgi:hypothetical protein